MAENQVKVTSTDTIPNYLYPKLQAGNGIAIRNNGSSIRIDAIDTNVVGTIQNVIQAGDRVTVTNTSNYVVVSADVQTGDHKVMASSSDTSPNYLDSKILQGSGITLNTASNYIMISADTQTGDHKVLVDSSDTNPQYLGVKLKSGAGVNISYYNHDKMEIAALGQCKVALLGTMDYLGNKILQGSGITLTKTDNDITIAANTQTGDHKLLVDGNDTTPGYLSTKLTAGSNITITNNGTDLEISAATSGMLNPMTTKADIIIGGTSGTPERLASPTHASFLRNYIASDNTNVVKWAKVQAGTGISLTDQGTVFTIAADTQPGDHKVLVDGNDTTPGYLSTKLTAGSNITITNNGTDLEISSTGGGSGMVNPMTTAGDLIIGGVSGTPDRLGIGVDDQIFTVYSGAPKWRHLINGSGISLETTSNYIKITADAQTGDHKVVVDGNDTTPDYLASKLTAGSNITLTNNGTDLEISATDVGFANPMTAAGDLIVGGTSGAPGALAVGTENQIITVSSGTPTWEDRPRCIDWFCPPGTYNGTYQRKADRTFYVRLFPTFAFKDVTQFMAMITSHNASDEWRCAIYNNSRNMIYYGTQTGNTATIAQINLTKLHDYTFDGYNPIYLAISQHTLGGSTSALCTCSNNVDNNQFVWMEDVALTSGRAMPSSGLTKGTLKLPLVGIRGYV